MTREGLLKKLQELEESSLDDAEIAHIEADKALLEFINDPAISDAFNLIDKWYA